MNRQRIILLWILVSFFACITILFVWDKIHQAQTHFAGGTNPDAERATLPPMRPPTTSDAPSRGSADRKALVIDQYADYTCLYCRITEPELLQAMAQSSLPVRLVWHDLPVVTTQPDAMTAALAGRCAKEQNKFWEMHDALFLTQSFDTASLIELARAEGLNADIFKQCLNSGRHLKAIQQAVTVAKNHNIRSAPTFFIGSTSYSGFMNTAQFLAIIQQAAP